MSICGQCGAEIKPGQQVCSQCGARIHLDEPGNADIMTEEILGIFPGVTRKKYWRGMYCKFVFTTNRLIVAKDRGLQISTGLRFAIWHPLTIILRHPHYIGSSTSANERLRMKTESADAILNENAENFEIPYSAITTVDISSKISGKWWNPKTWSKYDPIALQVFMGNNLDEPTHRFKVMIKHRYYDDFLEILHTVLPGKV